MELLKIPHHAARGQNPVNWRQACSLRNILWPEDVPVRTLLETCALPRFRGVSRTADCKSVAHKT